MLKKILSDNGYSVGWLSSEPQGEIFGADICFPYGFKSTIEHELEVWPNLISSIIKGIEIEKKPDIIISGHQAGMIPFSKNLSLCSNFENFHSLLYLGSVSPDAVIMNVSINDEIDFILRNINVLKFLYSIKVILIVLSMRYRENLTVSKDQVPLIKKGIVNSVDWKEKADAIFQKTQIPVCDIFNEDYYLLIVKTIEDFFSK
jgi:hypothetical protein